MEQQGASAFTINPPGSYALSDDKLLLIAPFRGCHNFPPSRAHWNSFCKSAIVGNEYSLQQRELVLPQWTHFCKSFQWAWECTIVVCVTRRMSNRSSGRGRGAILASSERSYQLNVGTLKGVSTEWIYCESTSTVLHVLLTFFSHHTPKSVKSTRTVALTSTPSFPQM